MHDIHSSCIKHGTEGEYVDYVKGANIVGFVKVADTMLDQGSGLNAILSIYKR